MNAIEATVSFATAEAFRNLNRLDTSVIKVEQSLGTLGRQVERQEKRAATLAEAYQKAETQFKKTGDAADQATMDTAKKNADEAAAKANMLSSAYQKASVSFANFGVASASAATQSSAAATTIANAHQNIGTTAKQGIGQVTTSSGAASSALNLAAIGAQALSGALLGMASGGAVIHAITGAIQELDESMRAARDTAKTVGQEQVTYLKSVKTFADNADVKFDKAGQDRLGNFVSGLQSSAPGLTPEVAAQILAKGQATGFKVIDKNRPQDDLKSQGFKIAEMISNFSVRNNLDPDTAGKLFNVAQLSGAKDTKSVEHLLAQIESAFQDISITDPKQGMQAAINASAGNLAQGVPIAQSLGILAAASIGQPDAARAATNAEQFTRVAAGQDVERTLYLSKLAKQYGLIDDKSLAKTKGEVAKDRKDSKAGDIADMERKIKEAELREKDREKQTSDYLIDSDQRMNELQFKLSQADKDLADPKKAKMADRINERRSEVIADIERNKRERADRIAASKVQSQTAKDDILSQRRKVGETKADEDTKITDEALPLLFQQLPLAARQELIWKASEGLSETQIGAFANKISQGRIAQQMARMLTGSGREAYRRAMQSGANPDIEHFRAKGQAYRESDVSQQAGDTTQGDINVRSALPDGQLFSNRMESLADSDIAILKERGMGATGALVGLQLELGLKDPYNSANSTGGLRAKRMMIATRNVFFQWNNSLDKRTSERHGARIKQAWAVFWHRWNFVFFEDHREEIRLTEATQAARDVGLLIQQIDEDAKKRGEKAGNSSAPKTNQANRSFDVGSDPEMKGGGGMSPEDQAKNTNVDQGGWNERAYNAPGRIEGTGNTPIRDPKQYPAVGGALGPRSSVNYNINVGQLITQGSQELDFPALLSVPDLGVNA